MSYFLIGLVSQLPVLSERVPISARNNPTPFTHIKGLTRWLRNKLKAPFKTFPSSYWDLKSVYRFTCAESCRSWFGSLVHVFLFFSSPELSLYKNFLFFRQDGFSPCWTCFTFQQLHSNHPKWNWRWQDVRPSRVGTGFQRFCSVDRHDWDSELGLKSHDC